MSLEKTDDQFSVENKKTAIHDYIQDWPEDQKFVSPEKAYSLIKDMMPLLGRSAQIDHSEFCKQLDHM